MREIHKTVEIKEGRKWIETYTDTNEVNVYKSLSTDLINKKLCSASYIKRIEQRTNYDGTQTVVVTYDNNCRATYVVEE